MIYYGWLIASRSGAPNQAARTIAAAKPGLLIAAFATLEPQLTNLSSQVRELLHGAGVQLCAYVPTGYGARDIAHVKAEAAGYLAAGIDGIFYDEVDAFADDAKLAYYHELQALVKDRDRTVIMNTGVATTGEQIMDLTDLLMLEHQWQAFAERCPWRLAYPQDRFMGVSSNEPGARAYVGAAIDQDTARHYTQAAWAQGIGWHYSADRYVDIAPWFLDYARAVR